ncbi:IS5 family transposase (plasmid) [Streptomyces sp. NBC_01527]|uniref:IS5 family transposase n=1 Tax=unclassified Streptomyces TaxID=2593676 RepID=UPI002E151638|nr:IS5 family transposase [Streptomyces sp. NBC_01230]
MGQGTWSWIVPDGLWEIARPLIPADRVRPQGGGKQNTPDEMLFAARAGVWGRLHEAVVHRLDGAGLVDVSRVVLDSAHVRAKKGGEHTGPSPVDRGKPGSKMHVLSDANGLPLIVGLSAANVHDSLALKPMVEGHQTRHDPYRGRYFKPQRLHADKAYDIPHLRRWLWGKHIGVRIARKGVESSERLGRRRWVIERTMSWLTGYRRLSPRYERQPANYLAFLGLAAALCCYKRLLKLTT